MTDQRKPGTDALIAARKRASVEKRASVRAAIEELIDEGAPLTMLAIAKRANVSTWLVYAPGVREQIEAARAQHSSKPAAKRQTSQPSAASLSTDLQLARTEIKQLRAERDKLKEVIARQVGAKVEAVPVTELKERIRDLNRSNGDLVSQARALEARVRELEVELEQALDQVASTREALKKMMRSGPA